MPLCCPRCFGDQYLEFYFDLMGNEQGDCPRCGSADQPLIEAIKMRDRLEILMSGYRLSPQGELLADRLREDWKMFHTAGMDTANASILLSEILDDPELIRQRYEPVKLKDQLTESDWSDFRYEMMHGNRFFPRARFSIDAISSFINLLMMEPSELRQSWHRARIRNIDRDFEQDEMGAPPAIYTSNGRANPAGIAYLYLGSNENTCAAEVRPHPDETVSIARFSIPDDLKIVDLRDPRLSISPFKIDDEDSLIRLRSVLGILEKLGQELSKPIAPRVAAIHYAPTQYICEYIKSEGYDGVAYKSSVGDGFNLALFNPEKARFENMINKRVIQVEIHTRNS